MKYAAIINTPGHLPDSDESPPIFDTAEEAWLYLWEEYDRAADETEALRYDGDAHERMYRLAYGYDDPSEGTITVPTPGYEGDHDLGLAYTVTGV